MAKYLAEGRICIGLQFEDTVHLGGEGIALGARVSRYIVSSQEAERGKHSTLLAASPTHGMVPFTLGVSLPFFYFNLTDTPRGQADSWG